MITTNDLEASSTSPIFSFTAVDSPVFIDVVNLNIKDYKKTVSILIVVTNRGSLYFYLNELNSNETVGKSGKKSTAANSLSNFKPFKQLNIETNENAALKINAAYLCNSKNERVNLVDLDAIDSNCDLCDSVVKNLKNQFGLFIVYGSSVNPRIEKLVNIRAFFFSKLSSVLY